MWPKMEKDIKAYVGSCLVCEQDKVERHKVSINKMTNYGSLERRSKLIISPFEDVGIFEWARFVIALLARYLD